MGPMETAATSENGKLSEDRDYVALSDTLAYETKDVAPQWRGAIAQIRATLK